MNNQRNRLVLIATDSDLTLAARSTVFHARPADRCEPWPAEPTVLTEIRKVAQTARIDPNLASVLIVERSLLDRELGALSTSRETHQMNQHAENAQVSMELSSASADYLRALSSHTTVPPEPLSTLRLPMRLSDRVLRFGLADLLRVELLGSAIRWERASLLTGQTMSEWALSAAAASH
jgi:hypothetical protein